MFFKHYANIDTLLTYFSSSAIEVKLCIYDEQQNWQIELGVYHKTQAVAKILTLAALEHSKANQI